MMEPTNASSAAPPPASNAHYISPSIPQNAYVEPGYTPPSQQQPPNYYQQQSGGGVRIPSYPPSYPQYYEEETSLTSGKAAALLTIGSALGLTAAAAVRWLNGGDFQLLPPATQDKGHDDLRLRIGERPESTIQERSHDITGHNYDRRPRDDEAHTSNSTDQDRLSEQVQCLVEALHSHTQQQEKVLQRVTSKQESHITNQSMDLLRPNRNISTSTMLLYAKLAEVHAELSSLRRDVVGLGLKGSTTIDTERWETRLNGTVDQLDECLQQIHPNLNAAMMNGTGNLDESHEVNVHTSVEVDGSANHSLDTSMLSAAMTLASLLDAVRRLAQENDTTALRVGAQLLYLYVINVSSHPHVPRYRKIFTSNESFQKVNRLVGGKDLLLAVGFVEQDKCLEWQPADESQKEEEEVYLQRLREAAAALSILKSPPSDLDKNELTESALAAAGAARQPARSSTPPPQPTPVPETEVSKQSGQTSSTPLKTPETNSIISPPATKKQTLLSPSCFSSVQPLSSSTASSVPAEDSLLDAPSFEDTSTPLKKIDRSYNEEQDEDTDALWK